jgi:hypothetical protein
MPNLDPIQQHHIENYGLNTAQPLASSRNAAAERKAEYDLHCKRMEVDQEYRLRWEQREKEFEQDKQRNYYY